MGIPHFRDDNYSLVRREMDVGVQAVPTTATAATQATGAWASRRGCKRKGRCIGALLL